MGTFKKFVTVMAVISISAFLAISCGTKKEETPAEGVDSTMTQTMPDSTGAAATDTTAVQ